MIPARGRSLLETISGSPLAVAALALTLYCGWAVVAQDRGHDAYDYAFVGQAFLDRSDTSPAIESNEPHAIPGTGYDGQFFLFIAQDPVRARDYIDDPTYRYGRILYPMAARAAGEGLGVGIPRALVGLNILAITLGVLGIALWLRRRGLSPWLALLFGLYPGVFVAVLRDLSDGIAYALVALAVLVFGSARPWALAASAGLFGLAVLTRETTAIFAVVWALSLLVEERPPLHWRRALVFGAAALGPYVAYRAFLTSWLGAGGIPAQLRPSLVPFGGIADWWPWGSAEIQQVYAVVLPGTLCLVLALWALRRGAVEAAVVALAVNALLYVVLLPPPSFLDFYSSLRIPTGVVLALLLAAPTLERLYGPRRTWLWLPALAWFSPWWQLLPLAFQNTW